MDGIKHNNGALGCAKSHLKCIKYAKNNNLDYCFIGEDDLYFNLEREELDLYVNEFLNLRNVGVMCVLSFVIDKIPLEKSKLLNISNNMQTATFYCVKKYYYDKIIDNFNECISSFNPQSQKKKISLDQNWKTLQKEDIWVTPIKFVGGQIESYSDIEKKNKNYNKFYVKNKIL